MSGNDRLLLARQWLEYAAGDFQSARALKETASPLRNLCYLAQQSVEKSLKALMIYGEIPLIKTHDLDLLLLRLPLQTQKSLAGLDLSWLSEWSVEARYPGDWPEATDQDAVLALEIAETILKLAKKLIKK